VPELIPIAKAAAEFGVSQAVIYRYMKLGRVTRYRRAMDRRTYVDRQELKRLVKPQAVRRTGKE